ncbi:MAG TPA: 3-hydroxyacyl-CoA dehydrogenase NAD-binding domain-containing protein [Novosphingobium sp.]|nr:3-hydroxyacyl-CoA dehydrogenase NAD-binding domain-containing protein [Novosphingobium sp.]
MRPIDSVAILGAGTMGSGIAITFLDAGIPVTLVEMQQTALDRGLAGIRKHYEGAVKKGRLSAEKCEQRIGLITPALDLSATASVDLVIEAVFENMEIKKEIFGKLDAIAKPGAILASNTSYLDIDEIASATSRPESVVGLHFFSPANVMRLLEVVRGARTAPEVIATGMKLAKRLGKVPVLSRVCHGFIANRVMAQRNAQGDAIVLEGVTPEAVDKAIEDYGFAMGPFRMRDLAGVDVVKPDPSQLTVRGELIKLGRLGQKSGAGYYDYDENRKATFSPVAAEVIARVAEGLGIKNSGPRSSEEIVARLLYPVVNEGAKLLEEGIALRASDIDVACITGFNWPVYTGGPMFWADSVGLDKIVATLTELESIHGAAFRPSELLKEKARTGGSFTR